MEHTVESKVSLRLQTGSLVLGIARRVYACRFVRAGPVRGAGNSPSNIIIEAGALSDAVVQGLFDAKPVFVDHAGLFDYPSLQNLAGVTRGVTWNAHECSVDGEIKLYDNHVGTSMAHLLDQILEDDQPPDVGLSMVFYPQWAPRDNFDDPRRITCIKHVESVDLVFEPAADGRVLEALSTQHLEPDRKYGRGGVFWARIPPQNTPNQFFTDRRLINTRPDSNPPGGIDDNPSNQISKGETPMTEENNVPVKANVQGQPEPSAPENETSHAEPAAEWLSALGQSTTRAMIQACGLPVESQSHLLRNDYVSPEEVAGAIEREREYLAALQENSVIQVGNSPPRGGEVSAVRCSLDQIREAYEALLEGVRPANAQPLSGVRELYTLLSGDYEMTGVFHPDRIQFANVTTSTMANLTADLLNKRVMAEFASYPQWWTPIVNIEDFPNLQDVKWIVLGGVGELPTVAEGAAYTELSWDDQKESDAFVKKGGYLGITLEAIDKDDTGRLRAAPRALAQAAWLTLSKSVAEIFTVNSGVGPTMQDSLALFHSTHGNLGTSALSVSSWVAARTAMRKVTEVNSGERLGALTAPRFLLVPPDLEITALQVLASEYDYTYALSNGTAAPVNAVTQGDDLNARMNFARSRVVVVDLWTDANNWAAVGAPNLYPTIGLGFRYGRVPEVFSVASPTAGLMFTNDTMPVKVRFFFATGPIDYRGLYKANVA